MIVNDRYATMLLRQVLKARNLGRSGIVSENHGKRQLYAISHILIRVVDAPIDASHHPIYYYYKY